MHTRFALTLILTLVGLGTFSQAAELSIPYEKFQLSNGLTVIFHEDKSDPIVAVAIQYHVGSNREVKGRTGFAHLFEHIMFQESQHVGQDQFFKKIQSAGGTLNGGTSQDGTIYFEVVPRNALEMALWLESDRMGFLLSKVTQEAFANQQGVVQNEKRQNYDNRPYGQSRYVMSKLLFPENHPYNWLTIGSLDDLANATLADVHEFYKKWYGPNNATLVVAGDFEKAQARKWVEKYFGEVAKYGDVKDMSPMPVQLSATRRAYYEDELARSPELSIVYPTVEEYAPDSYALDMLAELLGRGKKSPMYKVIVEEKKLAPSVMVGQAGQELAGYLMIMARAFPDKSLSDVEAAIQEAIARFEKEKFTEKDLERIKAGLETQFYNSISSVLMKAFQLARFEEYAGSAGFITKYLENVKAVQSKDVWRVYEKYVKGKPFVLTSFVPKGKVELAAKDSERFVIPPDSIDLQKKAQAAQSAMKVERIPTKFDRGVEPPAGPDPLLRLPTVWETKTASGVRVLGIEHRELPLVSFSVHIKGGQLFDKAAKIGVANLTARLMMQGTARKTPIELEEAIDELGASISVYSGTDSTALVGNCLVSKFEPVMALVEEILLEPRWDVKEFDRIKQQTLESIRREQATPAAVASRVFRILAYGRDHLLAENNTGSLQTVEGITLEDLKGYYKEFYTPSLAHISISGALDQKRAMTAFERLSTKWPARPATLPAVAKPAAPAQASLYFVDIPGARQSEIRVGYIGLSASDDDFYPATVANDKLGGSFNGVLNLILREEKGFTYGARSYFAGGLYPGLFTAAAPVQSNATLESLQIFRDEMAKYRQGIKAEDLAFTKASLTKSNARNFETLGALMGMLNEIAVYNRPKDFVKQREQFVQGLTLENHQKLAAKYIDPGRMIYLVVGDGKTQLQGLEKFGLGKPIVLDRDAKPVAAQPAAD
ncbi:MAG: insulinase family protein [Acidobacteria bacterium]|nr:MAG: insulinase family protein [Acidobacteriota bacterium]